MAAIPALIGAALIGTAGTVLSSVLARPRTVKPLPQVTRNDAIRRAEQSDILAGRRGTDANKRVGFGAGEAFTGPKRSLLGRA